MAGQTKTNDNQQFGVTSPDGNAPDPESGYGFGRAPMLDDKGRMVARLADAAGFPDAGFTTRAQPHAVALVTQEQIATGAALMTKLAGMNDSGAARRYVQVFDRIAALVGGEVPVISILVPIRERFYYEIPYRFAVGIRIGLSTDPDNFAAAAADLWWNAEVFQ